MDDWVRESLICPLCHSAIQMVENGARCEQCQTTYEAANGVLDLRPQTNIEYSVEVEQDGELPDVPYTDIDDNEYVSQHLSRGLVGWLDEMSCGTRVLDIGCGEGVIQSALESEGYEWVGVDVCESGPTIRADAHALPFEDDTFGASLSISALEHMKMPFRAVDEAARVTKSEGGFVGTTAFLENGHNSYHHMTPAGVTGLLESSGFSTEKIGPYTPKRDVPYIDWHGPIPIARRLFRPFPQPVKVALMVPAYALHLLLHYLGAAAKRDRGVIRRMKLSLAGQVAFAGSLDS